MANGIVLAPNQRFTVIGKTGSGKTTFSVVLASLLVPVDDTEWECWWLDSKRDPRDQAMLREWGFTDPHPGFFSRGRDTARKLVTLDPANGSISDQANWYAAAAIERKNVLVVYDEYKHCCYSTRRAGPGIEDNHLRGRGLNVGMLGQTQEPVEIPRQLLSQGTHIFLFDLTYPNDIKYARTLHEGYQRPKHRNGFYHAHIDGDAVWRYWPSVRAWHDVVTNASANASTRKVRQPA